MTRREAEAVLEAVEPVAGKPCGTVLATGFVQVLTTLCPPPNGTDLAIFSNSLADYLAAQPLEFVTTVCSPVHGLPTRQRFPLKLADVAEAVEAERKRQTAIVLNAKWALREIEKREAEAAEEARFEAERASMTPEERAVRAEAIRKRLVLNAIEPEPTRQAPRRMTQAELEADLAAIRMRLAEFDKAQGEAA